MNRPRAALIDAHVHFHACFDALGFIEAAYENFMRAANDAGCSGAVTAFLTLVETAEASWFDHLLECGRTGAPVVGDWTVRRSQHPCQVVLESADGRQLNVVSGFQIVTAEKLEVLALGSRDRVPDGLPIADVLRRVREANAIAVVPWGFGKWLGRRGEIVKSLVDAAQPGRFFLGDNSNRLAGLPAPATFERARAAGIEILLGTDPLPFPKEARRAGTAGFLLHYRRDSDDMSSWACVQQRLESREAVKPFGHFESLPTFAKNQIAMQIYKRTQPSRRPS